MSSCSGKQAIPSMSILSAPGYSTVSTSISSWPWRTWLSIYTKEVANAEYLLDFGKGTARSSIGRCVNYRCSVFYILPSSGRNVNGQRALAVFLLQLWNYRNCKLILPVHTDDEINALPFPHSLRPKYFPQNIVHPSLLFNADELILTNGQYLRGLRRSSCDLV